MTFGSRFNKSIEAPCVVTHMITLPSSSHSLTFGNDFNQSMDNVTLPSSLDKKVVKNRQELLDQGETRIDAYLDPEQATNCNACKA